MDIIQIDPSGYHAFVNIEWKGSLLRMLIDTGASRSVLDREWFDGFAPGHTITDFNEPSYGINSEVLLTSQVEIKGMTYDGQIVPDYTFSLIDLSGVNKLYSSIDVPHIHGIIGADWLVQWNAVLDFKGRKLHLNFQDV